MKKSRAWNSTLGNRTERLARSGPITPKRRLKPSGETKRKKRARYDEYMRSPEWRAKREECFKQAGYRCEVYWEIHIISARPNLEGRGKRCHRKPRQAHHKTYARLYNELPEDLAGCCIPCHRAIEQTYYPHRHGSGAPEPVGSVLGRVLYDVLEQAGDDA